MIVARLASIGVFLFYSVASFADFQWSDNFAWNRARVIAPRQHSWSFRSTYQSFDSRYNANGEIQSLGRPFDRTWTWKQILSSAEAEAQDAFHEYMKGVNQTEDDIAASTGFDLKRQETTFEASWAYGLSERWMIGLQVPISMVTTQLLPHTTLTSGISAAATSASGQNVRQQVSTLVQDRLASEGYDELQPRSSHFIVGDVSLMNQVSLWQNTDWALSLQQLTRIPSAPNNSVADYVRYSRGDGQIDFGLTAMLDYQWRRFLFGGKVGYVHALADKQKMRVPSEDGSQIVDRSVRRNLGDLVSTSFETFYKFSQRWTVNSAYLGFFKNADHYSGDNSSPEQYRQLGADSAQNLHIARAGVSYLIGRPTSREGIQNKWVANVNVYQPMSGRNISQGTQASLELQAFF